MGLLRADLQVLGNLPGTAAGRRLALSTGTGLALLGLMAWWTSQELLARPQLLHLLHPDSGDDTLRALFGLALLPCPVAATWLGLATAQRQLFESPELVLWQQAPHAGWRPAVQVLLRASFLALLWALALSLPMVLSLLANANAPLAAYASLPLAFVACTVPLVASLLAVQIVLVRFFAGRLLRLVFALLSALASVGFSTWLLLGLFTPGHERMQSLAAASTGSGRLPWPIDTAATMLANATSRPIDMRLGGELLLGLLVAVAVFWGTAHLHPRAVERHQLSERPLLQSRRRSWPATVAGTLRRKEFAQVLQQPGALLGFLVFGGLVLSLVHRRVLVANILDNWRLPRDLAHLGAMLAFWFIAVLLVLYAHMGRLAMWDGPQWSLYQSCPTRPAAILWGKLQAVAVFLLWPLLLVAGAGAQLLDASPTALLLFLAIALAGTIAALGVLAMVGTWPRLMRPDDGGQIVQGGRSFLAAMLLVLGFELAVSPAAFGWWWLVERLAQRPVRGEELLPYAPWVVGAAWLLALTIGGLGMAIGVRNFARLTQPQNR